jgi:hypothetical protein
VELATTVNALLAYLPETLREQPSIGTEKDGVKDILGAHWPEALQEERYQIGETGISSPVDISVLAGGQGSYSAVVVDGTTVTPEQRGVILAVIDPGSGEVLFSGGFDTYASQTESDLAAAAIDSAPVGAIVALQPMMRELLS